MPLRDLDKIKTKRGRGEERPRKRVRADAAPKAPSTYSIDGHQLGYVVVGGFVVAALVFAGGFVVGQRTAPQARPDTLAEVACLEVLDSGAPTADSDLTASTPAVHFEERLHAPVSPAAPADPALRLLARGRKDLALPGVDPSIFEEPEFAAESPAFDDGEAIDLDEPSPSQAAVSKAKAEAKPRQTRTAAKRRQAPKKAKAAKARYTLQVQAFRSRAEAETFARELSSRGHHPFVQESVVAGSRWYRVRVGKFGEHSQALAFQDRFEKQEGIDTFVTPVH